MRNTEKINQLNSVFLQCQVLVSESTKSSLEQTFHIYSQHCTKRKSIKIKLSPTYTHTSPENGPGLTAATIQKGANGGFQTGRIQSWKHNRQTDRSGFVGNI